MKELLDHGYLKTIEFWGSDESIIEAAQAEIRRSQFLPVFAIPRQQLDRTRVARQRILIAFNREERITLQTPASVVTGIEAQGGITACERLVRTA